MSECTIWYLHKPQQHTHDHTTEYHLVVFPSVLTQKHTYIQMSVLVAMTFRWIIQLQSSDGGMNWTYNTSLRCWPSLAGTLWVSAEWSTHEQFVSLTQVSLIFNVCYVECLIIKNLSGSTEWGQAESNQKDPGLSLSLFLFLSIH